MADKKAVETLESKEAEQNLEEPGGTTQKTTEGADSQADSASSIEGMELKLNNLQKTLNEEKDEQRI